MQLRQMENSNFVSLFPVVESCRVFCDHIELNVVLRVGLLVGRIDVFLACDFSTNQRQFCNGLAAAIPERVVRRYG